MSYAVPLGVLLASITFTPVVELSPHQTIGQWETSSAVLPGDLADLRCTSPSRASGDPQIFVSWVVAGVQRIMSCAMSELGTANCHSVTGTGQSLPGPCNPPASPEDYVAGSNDNVMVRLADGRIVQIVQTIKRNCPPANADGIDNDGDGVIDEVDLGFNGIDDNGNGLVDEPAEWGRDGKDSDGDGVIDEADEVGEFPSCIYYPHAGEDREQVSYVSRISDDCGQFWQATVLDAREVVDLAGNPLSPSLGGFDRVEAYADPWSDHVLLTAAATFDECGFQPDGEVVLHAPTPPGVTQLEWQRLFPWPSGFSSPLVMTSMPLGGGGSRVYWFHCPDWKPTLYMMDNPWNQSGLVPPSPHRLDLALAAAHPGEDFTCGLLSGPPGGETPLLNRLLSLGITRVASDGITDTVRLLYTQTFFDQGTKYQKLRVIDVDVTPDGTGGFTVQPSKELEVAPAGASTFYPSIIQADWTTADDPVAATHLVHWTEVGDSGTNREMVRSWDPVGKWGPETALHSWACHGECSPGDYQYGAFVDTLDRCTHRFFVPMNVQDDNNGNGWGDFPPDAMETYGTVVTTSTDEQSPILEAAPSDAVVECSTVPDPPALGATDDCDTDPEVLFEEVILPGECPQESTLVRQWTAEDNVGHVAVETQTLTVVDTTAPLIEPAPADATVECDAVPAPAQLGVTDACDDAPALVFAEERTDGSCPANYRLDRSWAAEDACANQSTEAQTVTVHDTTAPVVVPGSDDLYCLWPPKHAYVCFDRAQFAPIVTDNCGATEWRFVGCASDQAEDADGDGHTLDDCVVSSDGLGFCVRAERSGEIETGRRYAISIVAQDDCGNASEPTVIGRVHVPRDAKDRSHCLRP